MIFFCYHGCFALTFSIYRAVSHAAIHRPVPEEAAEPSSAARANEAHLVGSMMSSSSSSSSSSSDSYGWRDVQNLFNARDEARNMYSESAREVDRLELCLEAVNIALTASEEETNVARARTAEADARVAGKISFLKENLLLYSQLFVLTDFCVVRSGNAGICSGEPPWHSPTCSIWCS